MSKDVYYFSHDSNAKDDPKCVLLIEQLGMEGYGIYWMLIETLRDQPDYTYPVANIPALGRRYNTTAEKVKTVVYNYQLFTVKDDKIFFSESLNRRMIYFNDLRAKRSEAARLGNEARWRESQTDRNAIANGSQSIAIKVKESKYKRENKEKKTSVFSPPTLDEVTDYFATINGTPENAATYFDYFTSNGWRVSGKAPMKDWQASARNWMRNQSRFTNSNNLNNEPARKHNFV